MNDAGGGIDVENASILGIRQTGHAPDDGYTPVRTHIAVDTRLGTQRRIAGLAHHHDFSALAIVNVGIPCGRPFDRCAGHITEPTQGL